MLPSRLDWQDRICNQIRRSLDRRGRVLVERRQLNGFRVLFARQLRLVAAHCLALTIAVACSRGLAADVTFNINYISEANPFPPEAGSNFAYADVWSENGYAYVGSDRGIDNSSSRRGISVFSISNAGIPTFLPPPSPP